MNKPCRARSRHAGTIAGAVAALFAAASASPLYANPTGAQVVAGAVSVNSPAAGRMNITQTTPNAIVNWNTFSIGSNESVAIAQPSAASALLNRVIGNDLSVIAGHLQANGKVFLVNPAGVIFAPGASVNVGSMIASTLGISDSDFLAGQYHFVGAAAAPVSNAGSLSAQDGGTIALLGGTVSNTGTVSARLGTVALGAGGDISVDFAGDGLTTLKINQGTANALLGNTGTLAADGGTVVMSAQTADALASTVINQQGIVRAQSVSEHNGHILLDGGTAGVTQVSGTLDATGGTGATGGRIDVTGYDVALLAGARVDASGAAGGGTVRFGGGAGGADPDIRNANALWMSPDAQIHADALVNGNGGHVVAFSETASRLYGTLSAQGGAQGGNGGLIETSGHYLDTSGATIDASAPKGIAGTWLLDPYEVDIFPGEAQEEEYPVNSSVTFGPYGVTTFISNGTINTELNNGTSVTVSTATNSPGDINVQAPITKSAGGNAVLALSASGSVAIGYSITSTAGTLGVVLDANVGGGAPGSTVSLNGVTIDTHGGAFTIGDTGQSAVNVTGSTISTEAGNQNITGTAAAGDAIAISYSLLSTTSGGVTLNGTTALSGNGVNLQQSAIQTVDGAVSITGTGNATEAPENGVYIWGGEYAQGNLDETVTFIPNLVASGGGTFTVNGTLSGVSGDGVQFSNAVVSTASGGIGLLGTATASTLGAGILLSGSQLGTSGGSILMNGTAPVAGNTNQQGGVVTNGSLLTTAGNGNVIVTGTASGTGSATNPVYGVLLNDSSIQLANGGLSISGTAFVPNSATAYGVDIVSGYTRANPDESTTLLPTFNVSGAGSIGISGSASARTAAGINMTGAVIDGTTGAVGLSGAAATTATTTTDIGIDLSASRIETTGGAVTLAGTVIGPAAPALGNTGMGVAMTDSSIGTVDGAISVTGSSVGATPAALFGLHAQGVIVTGGFSSGTGTPAGAFTSTGAGSIDIVGTAHGVSGTGVSVGDTTLSATTGAISVNGSINTTNDGFGAEFYGTSMSTTSGNVTVTGIVSGPAGPNSYAYGVELFPGYVSANAGVNAVPLPAIATGSGNIAVTGSTPPTAYGSVALTIDNAPISSNSGSISLIGTTTGTPAAGMSSSGVVLESLTDAAVPTPLTITTGGALSIDGSGSGSNVEGVLVANGTQITSNNGGAIDIRGVATSPTPTTNGGNVQYDYGTLIVNGSVSSTKAGGTISIAGSTNTSDAGLAFGAVPISPANNNSSDPSSSPYTVGPVAIHGAPNGRIALLAANDNTSQSLLSRSATVSGGGGALSVLPATINPSTFAIAPQNSTPITLFGTSGGMTIDPATFASFVNFQNLTLGSDTQTGLIKVNGVCASGSNPCVPTKPALNLNLTLLTPGSGSQGIQLPYGLSVGASHALTLVSGGPVTDPGGIQAASLLLSGPGTFTLTDPQNDVGVLAMANAGTVNFLDSHGFTIGPLSGQTYSATSGLSTGINATNSTLTGNLTAQAATGNVALNTGLSAGGTVDLVMENGFFTAGGSGALTAANGWRIWESTWGAGEIRGNVQPNTAQPNFYGCLFGAGCSWGGTVPATGDHYVYAARPTATVTADDTTRVAGTPNPAFMYTVTGLVNGDTAGGALSGSVTSPATQASLAGLYPINPNFTSGVGYIVNDVAGTLTVTPPKIQIPDVVARSGLQVFFGHEEQTFVYENNLQGTNICVGSNQPIFTTAAPGETNDLLSVEWKRVRSQPNLNSCMLVNSQHGCGDF